MPDAEETEREELASLLERVVGHRVLHLDNSWAVEQNRQLWLVSADAMIAAGFSRLSESEIRRDQAEKDAQLIHQWAHDGRSALFTSRSLVALIRAQFLTPAEKRPHYDFPVDGCEIADDKSDLEPEDSYPADATQFAARWNSWSLQRREEWLAGAIKNSQEALLCFETNHVAEIRDLRSALTEAKIAAWDEGAQAAINHQWSQAATGLTIRPPANPYAKEADRG